MADFLDSVIKIIRQTDAPTLEDHCVRLQELQAGLSGCSPVGHEHSVDDVQDLRAAVCYLVDALIHPTTSIDWQPVFDEVGAYLQLQGSVIRKPGGGILVDPVLGLYLDVGQSGTQVSAGNHTHANLHPALSMGSCSGVTGEIDELQQLVLSLLLASDSGLSVGESGLGAVFGTGHNDIARGDHDHDDLHDALTVLNTATLQLGISASQVLSGTVPLDPDPESGYGLLSAGAAGLRVDLGTAANQAAAGNHPHDVATADSDGFMAASDKRKLDAYANLLTVDQSVGFSRHDVLSQGEYVGGRHRWGQSMQIVAVHLTALGGSSETRLGIEIDDVVSDTITVPSSSPGVPEVANYKALTSIYCPPDAYVRIIGVSGIGVIEEEPARLDVSLIVRPAVGSAPTLRINSGGLATTPFSADQYGTGGTNATTGTACDTSGVTNPAPAAVYQCGRRMSTGDQIAYVVTGLARGINYTVRLHFNQFVAPAFVTENFHIYVTGAVEEEDLWVNIMDEVGTNTALIKEYELQADTNGQIEVQIQPYSGAGIMGSVLCGLEFIAGT